MRTSRIGAQVVKRCASSTDDIIFIEEQPATSTKLDAMTSIEVRFCCFNPSYFCLLQRVHTILTQYGGSDLVFATNDDNHVQCVTLKTTCNRSYVRLDACAQQNQIDTRMQLRRRFGDFAAVFKHVADE